MVAAATQAAAAQTALMAAAQAANTEKRRICGHLKRISSTRKCPNPSVTRQLVAAAGGHRTVRDEKVLHGWLAAEC